MRMNVFHFLLSAILKTKALVVGFSFFLVCLLVLVCLLQPECINLSGPEGIMQFWKLLCLGNKQTNDEYFEG